MMTGNGTYHGDLITTVSIFIAMPLGLLLIYEEWVG